MSNFDNNRFSGLLKTKQIGRKIICQDVTGSTMDDARHFAHEGEIKYFLNSYNLLVYIVSCCTFSMVI